MCTSINLIMSGVAANLGSSALAEDCDQVLSKLGLQLWAMIAKESSGDHLMTTVYNTLWPTLFVQFVPEDKSVLSDEHWLKKTNSAGTRQDENLESLKSWFVNFLLDWSFPSLHASCAQNTSLQVHGKRKTGSRQQQLFLLQGAQNSWCSRVCLSAGGRQLAARASGNGVCAQPQGHRQDGTHLGTEGTAGGQVLLV